MTEPRPHWRNIIRPLSRLIWFRTSSCLRDKRATIMSRSWSRPSEVFVEELEFLFRCSRPCVICPPDDGAVFWRLRNPSVHASSRSENDWSSPVWYSILVQSQLQELTVGPGSVQCTGVRLLQGATGLQRSHGCTCDQTERQGSAHSPGSRPNKQDFDHGVHELVEKPGP